MISVRTGKGPILVAFTPKDVAVVRVVDACCKEARSLTGEGVSLCEVLSEAFPERFSAGSKRVELAVRFVPGGEYAEHPRVKNTPGQLRKAAGCFYGAIEARAELDFKIRGVQGVWAIMAVMANEIREVK